MANNSGAAYPHEQMSDYQTARLLCVQPIVKDTAEGLLREYVEHFAKCDGVKVGLKERARKLLEEK